MAPQSRTLALATLAALASQPFMLLFSLAWTGSVHDTGVAADQMLQVALFALLLVAVIIVVFFWPVFLLLRRSCRFNAANAALAGFVIGGVPALLLCFVGRSFSGTSYQSNWHGQMVQVIVDNQVSATGFLVYGELIVLAGLHGLAGALAFHYVWRRSIASTPV